MAQPSFHYRFHIDLSDVDRGVYENLDFRVAMHPSETNQYLVTRILAFALNFQDGLEFNSAGLSDPAEPAAFIRDPRGGFQLWIEIGNPAAKKLHKASKLSRLVRVYTYKDPQLLLKEISGGEIFKAEEIEVYSFKPEFLDRIAGTLIRDNNWSLVHTDGSLTLIADGKSLEGEIFFHSANSHSSSQKK
jgi:uncharacterized protein YaeQ